MYKELPYGKDLHGKKLELALNNIFSDYSTDAVAEKLASLTNSQRNEPLNSVIGSKNPKIRFYSGSKSNDFRVACGVAQRNLRASLCKILISSFAHKMDFAHNFSVDFF